MSAITLVISLLAGAIVVTLTAPPAVAIVVVIGLAVTAGLIAKKVS